MKELQRKALASVVLTEATVESFYDGSRAGTAEQCLKAMCVSHERLRAELQGAEILLNEEPGKHALRQLLTACKEAMSWLRGLNEHERVCRELIAAKVNGGDDLAIVLSNILRHLDNATEAVEKSLEPKRSFPDFEAWLSETFYGRDTDLKIEAIPHAHILDYEQAIRLATYIWECMENTRPPWWSKYKTAENATKALALTDTGSEEFKKAFPPKNAAEGQCQQTHQESVPGWRVVEKIREILLG